MASFARAVASSLSLSAIALAVLTAAPTFAQPAPTTQPQAASQPALSAQTMETLRLRIVASLLPDDANAAKDIATAQQAARSLTQDGYWKDIEYESSQRSTWPVASHANRILSMARGYAILRNAGKPDAQLLSQTRLALTYWLQVDPQCPNWWWNEIGMPQILGYAMLLLGDDADPSQRAGVINIMKRSNWSKWTGQNLCWGTGIQIYRGLLEQNSAAIREAYTRLYAEIRVAPRNEEGIMPDSSFHQHGAQLYSGGYGLGFASDVGRFVSFAWDTPLQLDAPTTHIYLNYLLDGERWMIYRGIFDYSAVGRELSRKGKAAVPAAATQRADNTVGLRSTRGGLDEIVAVLASLNTMPRRAELAAFAAQLRQDPSAPALTGNRHFWCSDYMVNRTAGSMFSIRMFSDRVRNTEEVNSENRKGHHLADGATYIYRTGNEYRDIFPCWNWDRIPGTTAELSDAGNDPNAVLPGGHKGIFSKTSFVGGVSDGQIGLAAMDLKRGGLSAHKAWACVGDTIICLGTGITCNSPREVFTTINQCLHNGEVLRAASADGSTLYWHDGIGYVIAPAQQVVQFASDRTGKWADIGVSNLLPETRDVFTLGVSHGTAPKNATYQYVVLPNIAREDFTTRAGKLNILTLRNDSAAQAVRVGGDLLIAFWEPGEVLDGENRISVDQPCLLLLRNQPRTPTGGEVFAISVANPKSAALAVTVNLRSNTTVQQTRFDLPTGSLAGSTVTAVVGK